MRRVLELAQKGIGEVNPNPLVGAVLVKDSEVIAEAHHKRYGSTHAEAMALQLAGDRAHGADLYVNWEPCVNYSGKKTPPCTSAIINSGIKRVILGAVDPTPEVNGSGIAQLRDAGVEVVEGVLQRECQQLNEIRAKYATTGLPFVLLKMAMTADGKIATRTGDGKWISSPDTLKLAHELRVRYAAVLVGIGTVFADDPQLTARHIKGRDPIRIVLDSQGKINPDAKILHLESPSPTVIVTCSMTEQHEAQLKAHSNNIEIWQLPKTPTGQVDLRELLTKLGEREIDSLFIEGGSEVAGAFLDAQLIDKVRFIIGPKLIGGRQAPSPIGGEGIAVMSDAIPLREFSHEMCGPDLVIEGYPDYAGSDSHD